MSEPQKSAAELLREVAAADPEAHDRALARAYGVGPTEPQISEEVVEAAWRAISGYSPGQAERWRFTSRGQRWHDAAYAALAAAVPLLYEQCAKTVEALCDWRYNPDNDHDYTEQHWAYHFGRWPGQTGVCPYAAMGAVLRGRPDPRRVAVARGDVQPGGQQ